MKIVISHSVTKRTINGTFEICGSREDLSIVARQIEEKLANGFSYGWVTVYSELPHTLANQSPIQWD